MGKSTDVEETPEQKAQAEHAVNLLKDYKQRWLPVQQRLAQTIEASGEKDSAARRLATGRASTDTAVQFDRAQGALEKSLTNQGAAPGSSRANLAIAGMSDDAATSGGLGNLMSEQAIDSAYAQGLGALAAIGRGERAQVGTSLSQQASMSAAQAAADAQASQSAREGNAQLVGQVAGFGLQKGLKGGGTGTGFDTFDPYGSATNTTGTSLPTAGGS